MTVQTPNKLAAERPETIIELGTAEAPTFREATRTWAYIGLNSFGGPAGQIAVMHRVLVDDKRWVSEERFLHALNYCMLLPGPEAQQLATYIGWLLNGWRGGLVAGTLFVIPGTAVIMVLSYIYAGFHEITAVQALFFGLKAAVLAIVVEAVLRIGKRALKGRFSVGTAIVAFVAIFFFNLPFPAIILGAALVGLARHRWISREGANPPLQADSQSTMDARPPSPARSVRVLAIWCVLWFAPIVVLRGLGDSGETYVQIGAFFSRAAVVTFGGAYSVLAYIAQQAVATYGWLQPGEMVDGLAMAETTPGPLIMVVQFVGFMAAFRDPGGLPPLLAGTFGGLLATWVTFAPCFLWIFLGAPYIEYLRGNRSLNAALSSITAAVVGVVLNLAVWFSLHTVFEEVTETSIGPVVLQVPSIDSLNLAALVLAIAAIVATFRFHVGTFRLLAACALAGIVYAMILG